MSTNEIYIQRCLQLAAIGGGNVAPNPMVGAVLVVDNKIIGEGYHKKYGQPHAEPNAINSVQDKALLKSATLYVNLEPCSHLRSTTCRAQRHKCSSGQSVVEIGYFVC